MKIPSYCVLIILILPVNIFSVPKLIIQNNEVLTFRVNPGNNDPYTSKTIYKSEIKNGSLQHSYTHHDEYSVFDVHADRYYLPEKIIYMNKDSKTTFSFDHSGTVHMSYTNGNETVTLTDKYMSDVTAENALVARTLDLESTKKHEFDLLQCDKLPDLVVYRMFFQVIGEESVTVEAGTFKCKKVLFSLTGWRGMFYKAYYYISGDEHRYLVKMENMPKGGSSELIKIEINNN